MFKKIVSSLLVTVMAGSMLMGCGSEKAEQSTQEN